MTLVSVPHYISGVKQTLINEHEISHFEPKDQKMHLRNVEPFNFVN